MNPENPQDPTQYQLKHEKAITNAPTPKLKHSRGRLYWQSNSGNGVEVEERHCTVCDNKFYVPVRERPGRAGYGLRERKCITCCKKCSRMYEQFSRESWHKAHKMKKQLKNKDYK